MSDGRVRTALEQMEAWLSDPSWDPDPDVLANWTTEYQTALSQAERASGWADLMDRAKAAGQLLEDRIVVVARERDRIRAELENQERGNRALRGYKASAR